MAIFVVFWIVFTDLSTDFFYGYICYFLTSLDCSLKSFFCPGFFYWSLYICSSILSKFFSVLWLFFTFNKTVHSSFNSFCCLWIFFYYSFKQKLWLMEVFAVSEYFFTVPLKKKLWLMEVFAVSEYFLLFL